ncbi:MAG: tRNA (N6-isopentenyl adenosine(37)-C2)-methylthiotransferase MiaB [Clostridia bacterium]|nr:tRNA (N6-isopentenyl adenosine(37)-C2)-methylthiotransferase MiaB [Clostridia bacterium]
MEANNTKKTGAFLPPETVQNQLAAADRIRLRFAAEGKTGTDAPLYYILTFGCQQNEADSERLGGLCVSMGYRRTEDMEKADLILVNTCAIREHAEKKALSIIGSCKHIREKNPGLLVGVGGCMVTQKHRADKLKGSYPYVSFTFDTGAVHLLPSLVENALTGGKRQFIHSDVFEIAEGLPLDRTSKHMAWLSVMYGCNNFCSYCIVPHVRGRERSRRMEDILAEAKMLIADGAKDITLLGQNVNSYGKDLTSDGEGADFADVMRAVCALDGDFRLRFMTSHPKDASDRLIAALADCPKAARHFHLPVQSGSDEILCRMNRKYTSAHYKSLIDRMKAAVPDISITSDIIVGFPGETEEDFEATLDMLRYVEYDMIFSFIYSPRPGTPAAEMEDQVPHEVSTARFERLLALQNEISLRRNERFLDKTLRVLVEGISKTDSAMLTGRGDPVRPVHFPGDPALVGQFVHVKIERITPFTLEGTLVN